MGRPVCVPPCPVGGKRVGHAAGGGLGNRRGCHGQGIDRLLDEGWDAVGNRQQKRPSLRAVTMTVQVQ